MQDGDFQMVVREGLSDDTRNHLGITTLYNSILNVLVAC